MNINVSIPLDQFEFLSAKSVILNLSVPVLIKNLLTYGRLTPCSDTDFCASSSRPSIFLERGVKRLATRPAVRRPRRAAAKKGGK